MARTHKNKGNRGEIEWKNLLIANDIHATRERDGLVDVESEITDVHWEVKRQESAKKLYDWIAQAERDAEKLGRNPVVVFRKNFHPWRCIVPAGFFLELLKIRRWALRNGYPNS